MTIASDIFRQLAYKVEATYGTVPAAGGAQQLRRVGSTLDLNKDTYQSNEIRTDFQIADMRHGVRRVTGKITGELSAKTYSDFFAALLKRAFAAVTPASGVSLTIAGAGPSYTVTRAAGSYLTDGFKVGDVIRLSVGALNANNINKNLLIVTLTGTVATVVVLNATAMTAEGPITGCTVTVFGKKTFIPQTGHTDLSYAIEHFYSDLVQSEVFSGCKFTGVSVQLPPTGMATVDFDVAGKDITTAAAQYFTSPTAPTGTGVMAAVNGVLRVNGTAVATVTGMNIDVKGNFSGSPVVGSNTVPAQTPGSVEVTGQMTVKLETVALRDAFINETEGDIAAVFTADNTATADFVSFVMPRVKFGGAAKAPVDNELVQTMPFTALLKTTGGTGVDTEKTTISIQDSQA